MSNPPGWTFRTALYANAGKDDVMAGLAAGVVTAGDVNNPQPTAGGQMAPSRWSYIWFGTATLYLVLVYTGHLTIARER